MSPPSSFTYTLTPLQQESLIRTIEGGPLQTRAVPHTRIAAQGPQLSIALYTSGKCVIQGKGAREWITFTFEPLVLGEARLGYEDQHHPEWFESHMGIDESGKGDFLGPLVISAVHVTAADVQVLQDAGVRDSKRISSDRLIREAAKAIRKQVGSRLTVVEIGPEAYNRLYEKFGNVNRLLAWGHARAIENILDLVPDCPRAVADQFGPKHRIESALLHKGRTIHLHQQPRAESDPAVAAASILARERFIGKLEAMSEKAGCPLPKGASSLVKDAAVALIKKHGPEALHAYAKVHFKTYGEVLRMAGVPTPGHSEHGGDPS